MTHKKKDVIKKIQSELHYAIRKVQSMSKMVDNITNTASLKELRPQIANVTYRLSGVYYKIMNLNKTKAYGTKTYNKANGR